MKSCGSLIKAMLVAALISQPLCAYAQNVDLEGYQMPDGSISTLYRDQKVDPYFATKALTIADDGGLVIRKPAMLWISWLIRRQRPDGQFDRYDRNSNGAWEASKPIDANDAMQAMWLELLYRETTSTKSMPPDWKMSIDRSQAQLESLYDEQTGIYHISANLPVGLLMDNVEIYAAFKRIAIEQKRLGMTQESQEYNEKADKLGQNILQVFGDPQTGNFTASTQKRSKPAFYPDRVANLFPILHHLVEASKAQAVYGKWMEENGHEWLARRTDDFPWGLVAVTALTMGDNYAASCWQNRAEPMRYSKHWNVLEEVILQDVKFQLVERHDHSIACVGGNLS